MYLYLSNAILLFFYFRVRVGKKGREEERILSRLNAQSEARHKA